MNMPVSKRSQTAGIAIILIVVVGLSGYFIATYLFSPEPDTITIHLCDTACVIIEYKDTRIFIDPWYFLENYTGLLADVVLITHPHFDHYNETTVNSIQKDETMNILPASMDDEVLAHDGVGVVPGDIIQLGNITITAFYMYTYDFGHDRSFNWTSYLIDINGFTIFHGGDAANMSEYTQLNGLVDVACLPIYFFDNTTIYSLEMIQPRYFIPYHFYVEYKNVWFDTWGSQIPLVSDCEVIRMDYWTSYTFEF